MDRLDLTIAWDGIELSGTLHRPDVGDSVPPPVVLMMQGSGPADRESGGYFSPIRAAFLRRGIATFSFDKPGCGQSTGNWLHYALNGRADQADAVLDFLKSQPAVDQDRLGIWGQSQGGWLTQMVAGRRGDLAFAIANSGPSIGVQRQDRFGCEHTLRAAGHDQAAIDDALTFVGLVHQAANDGIDYTTVKAELVPTVQDQPWYRHLTIKGADDWGLIKRFASEAYDPLTSLAVVSCPFLAIFGGQDVLVPAWLGAEETGRALAGAPTGDATVVVFPNGNHRIQVDGTDDFADGYLDLLGDWVAHRVTS